MLQRFPPNMELYVPTNNLYYDSLEIFFLIFLFLILNNLTRARPTFSYLRITGAWTDNISPVIWLFIHIATPCTRAEWA